MRLLAAPLACAAALATAQVPLPFTTAEDRLMVFAEGRFEPLEPRPAAFLHPMQGRLVYRDHQGQLKVFIPDGRRLHLLDRAGSDPRGTRSRIAWRSADTLKTLRDGRAHALATGVEHFTVSDSLIAWHDSAAHELNALWRGQVTTLARVERGSPRPQWSQGSNSVAFFNQEQGTLRAFHRGAVRTLCDSADFGLVVAGGDVLAWWDPRAQQFMALHRGQEYALSDLRPADAKAGDGLVAFIDGNGRLKCFERGQVHRVLDEPPSGYWVKDSLLLYLDRGRFMRFKDGASVQVEPYVPEQWEVEGGLLAWLDLNRELRGLQGDARFRFGSEAAIARFALLGDAVIYRSPLGTTVVATRRRTYVY